MRPGARQMKTTILVLASLAFIHAAASGGDEVARYVDPMTGSVLVYPNELMVMKGTKDFTLQSRNGEFKIVVISGMYPGVPARTSLFERMENEGPSTKARDITADGGKDWYFRECTKT